MMAKPPVTVTAFFRVNVRLAYMTMIAAMTRAADAPA